MWDSIFLHENVIKFIDVKPNEENSPFTKQKKFPNGIYNDIHELIEAINIACKESHFYFEQQKASSGKIYISINCDEKCKMHHINFSDNLLQMLLSSNLNTNFIPSSRPKSRDVNLIPMRQKRKLFLLTNLTRRWGNDTVTGVVNPIICGELFLIKCSYIMIFVRLIWQVHILLLRIVSQNSTYRDTQYHNYTFSTNLVKHFSFPNYILLRRTNFRTIGIAIRDHLENKIPFEFGMLTVTLHFKCKQ